MSFVLIFVRWFQERRSIVLGEGLIEVHMAIGFLLRRSTYLMVCGDSVHWVEMSGVP